MSKQIVFKRIGNKERLVDRVVNEIQGQIIDGRLVPGLKLPPERILAERIGVSRTVVREAVHILVTRGLLETKAAIGTTVRALGRQEIVRPLTLYLQTRKGGVSIEDLHQVRCMLEVENAGLAAGRAGDEELRELEQIMREMQAAASLPEQFALKDAEFHQKVAQITHNELLTVLLDSISDLMAEVRSRVAREPGLADKVMPSHLKILGRIIARDSEGARVAMKEHIDLARRIQQELLLHERKTKPGRARKNVMTRTREQAKAAGRSQRAGHRARAQLA